MKYVEDEVLKAAFITMMNKLIYAHRMILKPYVEALRAENKDGCFARNTLDCLKFIRELKGINIPVYFEKESINTMDSKGEVLLTIMASLAQQESQSLSQNVKLGLQYRYQQGQVQVNHKRFLGYTKDADGHLIVDPVQAEIVKRIYREYLEGKSMDKIAAGLEADGILTGAGKAKWHTSTIKKILTNEKYIGDALLQKTYTTDFLTKKRIKNNGTVPQYYVEGNHEAIIPKDIFLLVQEELARRRLVHTTENGKHRCYSCNHCRGVHFLKSNRVFPVVGLRDPLRFTIALPVVIL